MSSIPLMIAAYIVTCFVFWYGLGSVAEFLAWLNNLHLSFSRTNFISKRMPPESETGKKMTKAHESIKEMTEILASVPELGNMSHLPIFIAIPFVAPLLASLLGIAAALIVLSIATLPLRAICVSDPR